MKPGARPTLRLRVDSNASVSINRNGEAEIAMETGTLVQRRRHVSGDRWRAQRSAAAMFC